MEFSLNGGSERLMCQSAGESFGFCENVYFSVGILQKNSSFSMVAHLASSISFKYKGKVFIKRIILDQIKKSWCWKQSLVELQKEQQGTNLRSSTSQGENYENGTDGEISSMMRMACVIWEFSYLDLTMAPGSPVQYLWVVWDLRGGGPQHIQESNPTTLECTPFKESEELGNPSYTVMGRRHSEAVIEIHCYDSSREHILQLHGDP